MKTFFERFLDEVTRKLEAGEIDEEKAQRWISELQAQLQEYGQQHPQAPIVQMPIKH
jgi:cell division septum initiation protein DivIVA